MISPSIRTAELLDADRLAEVIHEGYESYRGELVPPTGAHAETGDSIRRRLSGATGFVAEVDGHVVGVVFAAWRSSEAYFDRLAVLPAFRRNGIASALIAEVERNAAAQGLSRVTLRARLAQPQNVAFFESLGYRVSAKFPHADTGQETYALLEKQLKDVAL